MGLNKKDNPHGSNQEKECSRRSRATGKPWSRPQARNQNLLNMAQIPHPALARHLPLKGKARRRKQEASLIALASSLGEAAAHGN
jgi:hypothetical protein